MNMSQISVQRPVLITMLVMIVMILGGISLQRIPIDLMPEITYPTLSVITSYENAGPEEIENLITRPIEQAVSAVPGVEDVTSRSSSGSSLVRIAFTWGTNLDTAANDLRDRLDRIMSRLPEGVSRPTLRKFDLSQFPILIMGVTSHLEPIETESIVQDQVRYRIERQPGVASLDIWGGLTREIHVEVFADKLKALGLSFDEIVRGLQSQNINLPVGTLRKGNYNFVVRTVGEYNSLKEIEQTVIAMREGIPIQLKEIATVEDSWQRVSQIIKINGQKGIRISVQKQSGSNTVEVARAVLKEMERINQDIPQLTLTPLVDTSDYIERSINNVSSSAFYGGILAVGILLFFLRNLRSTLIIATSIPVSIIATFGLIYSAGFTLNMMTLGGLAIGVGMIVDNAIVVLENTFRVRSTGVSSRKAAISASREVTPAIIASTLTTLVIFLPLIFVRGMSGVMFQQLAYVISFALLCSLMVSLTFIPMLSSRLLDDSALSASNAFHERKFLAPVFHGLEGLLTGLELGYKSSLEWSLRYRWWVVGITMTLFGASFLLIPLVGVELMPAADQNEVRVNLEMDVGTHLDVMEAKLNDIEAIVRAEVPEASNIISRAGSSNWGGGGGHTGNIQIALKPSTERTRSSDDVANDLRKKLVNIPGMTIRTRPGQGLFVFRMISGGNNDSIEIQVRGYELKTGNLLAEQIKKTIENVSGITDVQISQESGQPEERIKVDRDRAADLNLTVSGVARTLQAIVSGIQGSKFREGGKEYDILVSVKNADLMSLEEVLQLTMINAVGQPVMLRNVVSSQLDTAPVQIERSGQQRVIAISANIAGRDLGTVVDELRQQLSRIPVPKDFNIVITGDYEAQQEAFGELMIGMILALILIYMVMACLYESLRDPLLVMFSVPLALIGVVLILFLTHSTFNVQSYIGCIMLAGIVVNNAILLVDTVNLLRNEIPLHEAIIESGRRRLRPILMTASTTVLGMVPMALGLGEGGETQAPMARVIIGGLTSSTLITLIFIPVLYSLFEQWIPKKTHQEEE
ncbi:MAG: efflux RND transporter permease subunit [SAR324 cluster bacterium]|nr:efflux RND transporter permease subunit [SAR324 cluster bacterium]